GTARYHVGRRSDLRDRCDFARGTSRRGAAPKAAMLDRRRARLQSVATAALGVASAARLASERFRVRPDDRLELVDFFGDARREVFGSARRAQDIVFDAHADAFPARIDIEI